MNGCWLRADATATKSARSTLAENGPIARGDLLVTSFRPGFAMKGTNRSRMLGAVVGKALEPLPKDTGLIQVLVTLQ